MLPVFYGMELTLVSFQLKTESNKGSSVYIYWRKNESILQQSNYYSFAIRYTRTLIKLLNKVKFLLWPHNFFVGANLEIQKNVYHPKPLRPCRTRKLPDSQIHTSSEPRFLLHARTFFTRMAPQPKVWLPYRM